MCEASAAARPYVESLGTVRACCGWSGRHSRAPGQNELLTFGVARLNEPLVLTLLLPLAATVSVRGVVVSLTVSPSTKPALSVSFSRHEKDSWAGRRRKRLFHDARVDVRAIGGSDREARA